MPDILTCYIDLAGSFEWGVFECVFSYLLASKRFKPKYNCVCVKGHLRSVWRNESIVDQDALARVKNDTKAIVCLNWYWIVGEIAKINLYIVQDASDFGVLAVYTSKQIYTVQICKPNKILCRKRNSNSGCDFEKKKWAKSLYKSM